MEVPPGYLSENAVFGAGASGQDVFVRGTNSPPLCIVGLSAEAILPANRTFRFSALTRGGAREFVFMRKSFTAVVNLMVWKDFNCPAGAIAANVDMNVPCIVIPPGGSLRVQGDAGAAMTVVCDVQAFELTKAIIARIFRDTGPETVSFDTSGRLSILQISPGGP